MQPEVLNKLIELYPDHGNKEIASIIGFSANYIQIIACRLKLSKSAFFMKNKSSRYKLGHIPATKFIKGIHYSPKTEFKPGHIPANTKPIGCITVRNNSTRGSKYLHIKLSDRTWKEYHIHIWEKEYGPVPAGYILVFKNKDTMNVELENLEIITRGENAERNRDHVKASESLRETWRKEKLRVKYDLPRQTKFHVTKKNCY